MIPWPKGELAEILLSEPNVHLYLFLIAFTDLPELEETLVSFLRLSVR